MSTRDPVIDVDAAAEFLLRRRGLIGPQWIVVPWVLGWCAAFGIAVVFGMRHRAEYVPYVAALYLCLAYFVYAYIVAWRIGSIVWRYSSLMIATAFHVVLGLVHADEAAAALMVTPTGVVERPPEPAFFLAVSIHTALILILLVHGFVLGLGSRAPVAPREASASSADDDREPDATVSPEPEVA